MAPFIRNLTFQTDPDTIKDPVDLMLTFEKVKGIAGMSQVAWRVLSFGGGGDFIKVTYKQEPMFCAFQAGAKTVSAATYKKVGLGQSTKLIKKGAGAAVGFTDPEDGQPEDEMLATNTTGVPRGMGVGFVDDEGKPQTVLGWQHVGDELSVQAKWHPYLSVYATSGYQETELITGKITSKVLLDAENLAILGIDTTYTLKKDSEGHYKIVKGN